MNRERAVNLPLVIILVAGCLTAVHLTRQALSENADLWVLLTFGFIPARYSDLSEMLPGGAWAKLWTPITHAFLHGDGMHLLVNLVWMAGFGTPLARRFRATRFLVLSAIAAVAGAGLNYALHAGEETILIGASGAISGMMAGTARFAFAPNGPLAGGRSSESYLLPAQPLAEFLTNARALFFILIWFGTNFVFGFIGDAAPGVSGPIAWEAHVGGFVAGFLLFSVLDPVPRQTNTLVS